MTFEERKPLYEQIERERGTKIVSYDKTVLPFPVHRDTTALDVVRKDGTGDTGCLLEIIKDSTVILGPPPSIMPVTDLPEWQQDEPVQLFEQKEPQE